ncbi:MAG: hypothetical protein WD801_12720 [Gemmatimonadaceae bacterium]
MSIFSRVLPPLAVMLVAAPFEASDAQRRDWDDTNVEGAESCRAIWREYGRTMSGRPSAVHCEIRDVGVTPARRIDVDGDEHGGLRVVGAQRSDIRVRLVIQTQGEDLADARDLARQVSLDLSRATWRPEVPVIRDNRRIGRRYVSATVLIDAPRQTDLIARVEHAPMWVEGLRGRLDLDAAHGPLNLNDVGGDVRARVRHGPLTIAVTGRTWDGAGLDAQAEHGPLTLRLPREFDADLEMGAEHGPMDIDFPVTLTRFDRTRISTKLGAGGPRIRAFATHGPLSVHVAR